MRIVEKYSHLNGHEFLLVHKPELWAEIEQVIQQVDASMHVTKKSKEKRMMGRMLYSPIDLNESFKTKLNSWGWRESRVTYWVTENQELIRSTYHLADADQKRMIEAAGKKPIKSYNQTDFVKERIAVEVQFGKYAFVAFDLFVKHLAFYVRDQIDVGIEILPMKAMTTEMSSGIGYYEGELYNVLRNGRGVPAVPLVLVGIAP